MSSMHLGMHVHRSLKGQVDVFKKAYEIFAFIAQGIDCKNKVVMYKTFARSKLEHCIPF